MRYLIVFFCLSLSFSVLSQTGEIERLQNRRKNLQSEIENTNRLYLEADEDHASLQEGKCAEPKLVYVHEGIKTVGERSKLINPRYFSGIYADSDELWLEVADYIDKAYDENTIEKIYLSEIGRASCRERV